MNLPFEPALVTMVRPPALSTSSGNGMPSCVCPPRMASMPVTSEASFRSTSMPLCDSSTTAAGEWSARMLSTSSCSSAARMPNVQSGMKRAGLAMGV